MGNDSFNQEGNSSKLKLFWFIPSIDRVCVGVCVCGGVHVHTHMHIFKQSIEIGDIPILDTTVTVNTGKCLIVSEVDKTIWR